MDPEEFRQAWQMQTSQRLPSADAELLLEDVQQKKRSLRTAVFWRDVREVGVALLLVPLWFFFGVTLSLPWTWYLVVPGLLWIAGYLLVDRIRHQRRPTKQGEPLRHCVEASLAQVEHQIWLLRNVHWWYLLPLLVPMLVFFGHVSWNDPLGGWWSTVPLLIAAAVVVMVFAGVWWVNQKAVRADLEPRRRELAGLLRGLEDEVPAP